MRAALIVCFLLLGLSGCSLTTGGFQECASSSDCGDGRICEQGYCVVNQIPAGCGRTEGRADDPNAIHLGVAFPLVVDGAEDPTETQGLNAVLLALGEINQRDGVGGRPFALHVCDTGGDAERIKLQSEWLIDQRNVKGIITSWSSLTLAAASVTIPKNTVVIASTATSPELTSLPDTNGGSVGLVWRTAPSDAIQGRVISDILRNDPAFAAVQKVGILYVNDPYGQGLAEVLSSSLAADTTRGIQTKSALFELGGDLDTPLSQLDAWDPDLTVLVAFPEDGVRLLTAAASSTHLKKADGHQWFFTDSTKVPTLTSIPDPAEIDGAWGTAPAQGAGVAYASFRARFESTYGNDPDQVGFVSHNYDAMYVLALGAAWAVGDGTGEVTGTRIAEGMTQLSSGTEYQLSASQFTGAKAALQAGQPIDIAGASGSLDFDAATGEAPAPIEVWQVKGSTFITLEAAREPPAE